MPSGYGESDGSSGDGVKEGECGRTPECRKKRSSTSLLEIKKRLRVDDEDDEYERTVEESTSSIRDVYVKSRRFVPRDPGARLNGSGGWPGFVNCWTGGTGGRTGPHALPDLVSKLSVESKLEQHEGCVNSLEFNRSGTLLVSGSDDLNMHIWDWANSTSLARIETPHQNNIFQTRFVPYRGDREIVTGGRDGRVFHINIERMDADGKYCSSILTRHGGPVHKIVFDKTSMHTMYTCSEDGEVRRMDLRDSISKHSTYPVIKEPDTSCTVRLYNMAMRPNRSHEFAVCGTSKYVYIFDVRMVVRDERRKPFRQPICPSVVRGQRVSNCRSTHSHYLLQHFLFSNQCTSLAYSHDGTELLANYTGSNIYLLDASATCRTEDELEMQPMRTYVGLRNTETIKGVSFFGPNSEYVLSGCDCGYLFAWDKQSEKVVFYDLGDSEGAVNVVETHPTSPIIATSGIENNVKIWTPTRQTPIDLTPTTSISSLAFLRSDWCIVKKQLRDAVYASSFTERRDSRSRRMGTGDDESESSTNSNYSDNTILSMFPLNQLPLSSTTDDSDESSLLSDSQHRNMPDHVDDDDDDDDDFDDYGDDDDIDIDEDD